MKAVFFHLLLLCPVFSIHAQENSGNSKGTTSKILKDTLDKAAKELKEVRVTATRPLVDVQSDRIIVNVEGSVNSIGQDAMELLRKSPGVVVDKDDNLMLNGKNGVQVYINGKPSPLSGNDLSQYLRAMQSAHIESIEIISNPSAKYAAAGNGGIINIRLQKNKAFGTNGTLTAGYGIGIYSKYNAGISFNHRSERVHFFSNYNYNERRNEGYINTWRHVADSLFIAKSNVINFNRTHNTDLGLDYEINKKNTLGLLLTGSFANQHIASDSRTAILYAPANETVRTLVTNNRSIGKRNSTNIDLNYRFAGSNGREVAVYADYGIYRIKSNQLLPGQYFEGNSGTLLYNHITKMVTPTKIHIYSVKSDYQQNLFKGKMCAGFKASYVTSGNDFRQYSMLNDFPALDIARSNRFDYKENINALYLNYNKNYKSWLVQAGVRMENTHATGISAPYLETGGEMQHDSSFKRRYNDFFPSAAISFNKNPERQWTLNYSRRIDRPAYTDLNPFEYKLDDYNFRKGNTNLKPQYTHSVGLTFLYKQQISATLNYSHVKDVFAVLRDTVDRSRSFVSRKNLAFQDITSLNLSYPLSYKWYGVFTNLNSYTHATKPIMALGRNIALNTFAFEALAQQSFKIRDGWKADITTFYNSPSIAQGTFKVKAFWSADMGIQKSLLTKRLLIKASLSDIFHSLKNTGSSDFASQYVLAKSGGETRVFRLFMSYQFGSSQVKPDSETKTRN